MSAGWLEEWTRRYPLQAGGISISLLIVRIVRQFLDVRVMGLAAEMTYYALLSLLPLTAAMGASLGFLERLVGSQATQEAEAAILQALQTVFSPEATAEVVEPLVQGLLRQERAGFALSTFLITLFFASRIFRSAIDCLDTAYRVEERRGFVSLWTLGILLALGAVLVVTTILAMVVVGPLLGGGRAIADWLGLGTAFEVTWAVLRWPVVFGIATAYLSLFYHLAPNVKQRWAKSLPGAIFGMLFLILVALAFRTYIEATGLQSPQIADAGEAVAVALHVMGALMAVLFWIWLSSMVVLTGGVINAEVSRMRRNPLPQED